METQELKTRELVIQLNIIELHSLKEKIDIKINEVKQVDYSGITVYTDCINIIYDRINELKQELKLLKNE